MPVTGYMKIPGINGESKAANHEDEIEFHGIEWGASRKLKGTKGIAQTRGKSVVSPLEVVKFYDAASPYLAEAAMRGKRFDEIVLNVHRDTGGQHLDYLVITLGNCLIKNYQMANEGQEDPMLQIREWLGIRFDTITIKYTVQADDHSAGDEHEVAYDIAAGA